MKDLFGNERFIFIIKVASYKISNSESVGVNNKINSAYSIFSAKESFL